MATRRPALNDVDGDPIFVTVTEAAYLLRIGPNTVRTLADEGELGPKKYLGKGARYHLYFEQVKAYADSRPEEPVNA